MKLFGSMEVKIIKGLLLSQELPGDIALYFDCPVEDIYFLAEDRSGIESVITTSSTLNTEAMLTSLLEEKAKRDKKFEKTHWDTAMPISEEEVVKRSAWYLDEVFSHLYKYGVESLPPKDVGIALQSYEKAYKFFKEVKQDKAKKEMEDAVGQMSPEELEQVMLQTAKKMEKFKDIVVDIQDYQETEKKQKENKVKALANRHGRVR